MTNDNEDIPGKGQGSDVHHPLKIKLRIPANLKSENVPVIKQENVTEHLRKQPHSDIQVLDSEILSLSGSESEIEINDTISNMVVAQAGKQAAGTKGPAAPGAPSLRFIQVDCDALKNKKQKKMEDDLVINVKPTPPTSTTKKPRREPREPSGLDKVKSGSQAADLDVASKDKVDGARSCTVYIQVYSMETKNEPKCGTKSGKTTTTMITVTKGPFEFNTSRSFIDFQDEVAAALPCRRSILPVSKFEWKFDKEAKSAPHKKIGNVAGFDALVTAITKTRASENVVVWLRLPKPVKEEDSDWDTSNGDFVEAPFDFDAENDTGEVMTKNRIDAMTEKRRAARVKLEAKYPIGNIPMFQGKRVWQNPDTASYIELTDIRLNSWANALAGNTKDVTTSSPPHNLHFAEDKRLKVLPTSGPIAAAPAGPMPGNVPFANHDTHAFATAPAPYQYHQFMPYIPHPGFPYSYPGNLSASAPNTHRFTPWLPPSPQAGIATTAHNVSLAEFCVQYGLSKSDEEMLGKLEYRPGDKNVERLDEKHWSAVGFSFLRWQGILDAHRRFVAAIKAQAA